MLRDELVPAVDDAGVVVAAGEVGDLQDLLQVDWRPEHPAVQDGQEQRRRQQLRISGILARHDDAWRSRTRDFDLLHHFFAGELVGVERGQVAALDAEHDGRRVVQLPRRERALRCRGPRR